MAFDAKNSGFSLEKGIEVGQAPVAQLDRASVYGTEGLGFESLQAYFPSLSPQKALRLFGDDVPLPTEPVHA